MLLIRKFCIRLRTPVTLGTHPLLQTSAKASSHAIADLIDYVATLRAVDSGQEKPKDAIGVYEMEMIAKGEEKVSLSTMNTETVHDCDRLIQSPFSGWELDEAPE